MMQSRAQGKRARMGVGQLRRRADMDEKAKGIMEEFAGPLGLGRLLSCECHGLGTTVSIIVARYSNAGWCLVITHTKRFPTWDELAEARHRLVPNDVNMAIPFPADERYVPLHKFSIVLTEVEPKTSRLIVEAPNLSTF